MADQAPKIKYKVPISLWFVENNHCRDLKINVWVYYPIITLKAIGFFNLKH